MASNTQIIPPTNNLKPVHVKELEESDLWLRMVYNVSENKSGVLKKHMFLINDFLFQVLISKSSDINVISHYNYKFYAKLTKIGSKDKRSYTALLTHKYDGQTTKNKRFTVDDTWQVIDVLKVYFKKNTAISNCVLTLTLLEAPSCNSSNPTTDNKLTLEKRRAAPDLYEDTELIDFELRGKDGSVHLHKAIAAAASPVLKTMFLGEWRETAEGVAAVPETTKVTLQHFKEYLYLDTLPETGLEELLTLASYYMISDLEVRCVFKLMANVTSDNVYQMIKFAVKHDVKRLLKEIMEYLREGKILLNKIPEFVDLDEN